MAPKPQPKPKAPERPAQRPTQRPEPRPAPRPEPRADGGTVSGARRAETARAQGRTADRQAGARLARAGSNGQGFTTDTQPTGGGGGSGKKPKPKPPPHLVSYGQPLSSGNIAIIKVLMQRAHDAKAPTIVQQAILYAAAGESNFSPEAGNGGPLQTTCNYSAYSNGTDWAAQADAWLLGGECFTRGGISYSHEYDTIWQIANATEENAVWGKSRGDSYARGGFSTQQLEQEAAAIQAYYRVGAAGATSGGGGYKPPTGPNTHVGGSLLAQIKTLNWAGNAENVIKYIADGAAAAAATAGNNRRKIVGTTYVKPS